MNEQNALSKAFDAAVEEFGTLNLARAIAASNAWDNGSLGESDAHVAVAPIEKLERLKGVLEL